MAHIAMTDDGIDFEADALETGPLGGAETAFSSLARALAARGHAVSVRNKCTRAVTSGGIDWAPLADGVPADCDLHIANRSDKLLPAVPGARRTVFWIHNPGWYLLKYRYLSKLWRLRPPIVFSGPYHKDTYPFWAPDGGRVLIPYGISEIFRETNPPEQPPGPRAIFTSNPVRGLDWLLDVWAGRIHPRCAAAELHLFTGAATYGSYGRSFESQIAPLFDRVARLRASGVVLRDPLSKRELAAEMTNARVHLYRGNSGETFCLAVGEAQAAGVPAVVQDIGCVAERVIDGETGFVAVSDADFADAAVRLLTDDALWRRHSRAAAERQRGWGWDAAAAAFEELIP